MESDVGLRGGLKLLGIPNNFRPPLSPTGIVNSTSKHFTVSSRKRDLCCSYRNTTKYHQFPKDIRPICYLHQSEYIVNIIIQEPDSVGLGDFFVYVLVES
jgi:hypothetical protein